MTTAVVNKPGHPAHGLTVRMVGRYKDASYSIRWDETDTRFTTCALSASELERETCDRAEIAIQRAVNCGWITVHDREQLKATLRIGLDMEAQAGGPYLVPSFEKS